MFRRWFRRLCTFFEIRIHGKPKYLLNKIPSSQTHYNTRNTDQFETYYCRTDIFKNSFFPYTTNEWNKLDVDVRKSKSYAIFLNTLLKLGRPNQNAIYNINNPVGLKPLTCLRLGLSHLNEHSLMNLITTLKTALTLCVVAALKLNQLLIFYCIAIIIPTSV